MAKLLLGAKKGRLVFHQHRNHPRDVAGLTIGEAAARLRAAGFDVSTSLIRKLESEGLLEIPLRSDGNYRVFDEQLVEKLALILRLRHAGLALDDVKEIVALLDKPRTAMWHARMKELIAEIEPTIVQRMNHLRELKSFLRKSVDL